MPYYSPTQVSIFINDILVDDIHDFSFEMQQARVPLYGYRDVKYRKTAKGRRIVQGQFGMNFRRVALLVNALQKVADEFGSDPNQPSTGFDFRTLNNRLLSADNVDGETLAHELMEKALKSFTDPKNSMGNLKGQTFYASAVQGLKNAFWGQSHQVLEPQKYTNTPKPVSPERHQSANRKREDPLPDAKISIIARYGPINQDEGIYHLFTDVELTSLGQRMTMSPPMDGEPIQEVYSFIARDIEAVSLASNKNIREPRIPG